MMISSFERDVRPSRLIALPLDGTSLSEVEDGAGINEGHTRYWFATARRFDDLTVKRILFSVHLKFRNHRTA
jgi:hypothetical protein